MGVLRPGVLEQLQTLRLKLHRLNPPRPLRDVRAAVPFVRERKIVLPAGRSSLPMLAEAIVGHEIRGSWMADPEVYRIHRLMRRVHRSRDIVAATLIQGKETLIDASLGPAVERVAADGSRREEAYRVLPPDARVLLDAVDASGEVRMDRWKASPKRGRAARLLLVQQLLVVSAELHTESGYHTALVRPWRTSPIAVRFAKTAAGAGYGEAVRTLWLAAVKSAVLVPEREARRWFPFGDAYLDDVINAGKIERLSARGRAWLTCEQ